MNLVEFQKANRYVNSDHILVNIMELTKADDNIKSIDGLISKINLLRDSTNTLLIVFSFVSEGLPYLQLKISQKIIKKMIFNGTITKHVLYLSGGHPCLENIAHYRNACKIYNWEEIPIIFANNWECARNLYQTPFYDEVDTTPRHKSKKFVCYNNSVKPHRMFVTLDLINKKLVDKGFVSNYYDQKNPGYFENGKKLLSKNYNRLELILKNYLYMFPMTLGEPINEENIDKTHVLCREDLPHYNDSYFAIVTETKFFHDRQDDTLLEADLSLDCFFFTEKTFKFIEGKMPFILVGFTGCLDVLRRQGYKTFYPFIDETYDTIEDDETRLEYVMNEVERLCNLSDSEMIEWQKNIEPIVLHNYNFLKNQHFNKLQFK